MTQETKDYIFSTSLDLFKSGTTDPHLIRESIQYGVLRERKEFYTNDEVYFIVIDALNSLETNLVI